MSEPSIGSHYCSACGQPHGATGKSDAVRIAEIERDRAIEIAKLERGMAREEVAADVETTEIRAEADVEVAGELAGALAETPAPEPETEPEVVVTDPIPEPDPVDDIAPPDTGQHHEPKTKSGGMWGFG
jgi:hypothetical protein